MRFAATEDSTTALAGMAMAATGQVVAVFPGYAKPFAAIMGVRPLEITTPQRCRTSWRWRCRGCRLLYLGPETL